MIRRIVGAALAAAISVITLRVLTGRGGDRLLAAPRTMPDEDALGPALDALGGEVVRVRSRDGLRLSARWLPAERAEPPDTWQPDPHDAILLLHGWSGSCAPDVVEYGPFLRRTAGVLGLDFRGHGESDPAPTTFGLQEVEDVAGALAWLGERGIERVALVGISMGGGTAIAAVAVLGDGSLQSADADPAAAAHVAPPRRPRIVAVVADSATPELAIPIATRLRGPATGFVARRLLDAASRTLGADPRETEPLRVVGLLEGTPLLLISGDADSTVPIEDARRLAAAAPDGTTHLIIPLAEHSRAHATDPDRYASHVTDHLRSAFVSQTKAGHIIDEPGLPSADVSFPVDVPDPTDVPDPANSVED